VESVAHVLALDDRAVVDGRSGVVPTRPPERITSAQNSNGRLVIKVRLVRSYALEMSPNNNSAQEVSLPATAMVGHGKGERDDDCGEHYRQYEKDMSERQSFVVTSGHDGGRH